MSFQECCWMRKARCTHECMRPCFKKNKGKNSTQAHLSVCIWEGVHQGVNMATWGQGEVGRCFGWMVGRGGCWKALEKQKAAVMWPCSAGRMGYKAGARAMGPGCNAVQLCHLPVVLQWRAQQYSWSTCYVPGLACTLVTEGWRCCSCPLEGAMLKKEGERSTCAGIFHPGCYGHIA